MDRIVETNDNSELIKFGKDGQFFRVKSNRLGKMYQANIEVYSFSTGRGHYIQVREFVDNISTMSSDLPERIYAYGGRSLTFAIRKAEKIARRIFKNPFEDIYRKDTKK